MEYYLGPSIYLGLGLVCILRYIFYEKKCEAWSSLLWAGVLPKSSISAFEAKTEANKLAWLFASVMGSSNELTGGDSGRSKIIIIEQIKTKTG